MRKKKADKKRGKLALAAVVAVIGFVFYMVRRQGVAMQYGGDEGSGANSTKPNVADVPLS